MTNSFNHKGYNLLFSIFFSLTLFVLSMTPGTASAQAPQAIPYQAVARDNTGATLANQAIALRLSIHDTTATGTIVYQETQTTTTNSLGLFNLNIGQGTPITGNLSGVNWANGLKFIQVEMDPTGGTSYTDMGTTQLMSVPYALSSADNQWTKSGNDINNSNTGHVSIGTSNPNPYAKLTVQSDLYGLMHINGSTEIGTWADTSGGWFGTKSNHPLHLFTNDAAPQITLKQNGNVGIGTIAPSEKLHTTGGVRHEGLSGMGSRIVYADSTGKLTTLSSPITGNNLQAYTIPDYSCTGVQSNISINGFPNSILSSKISVTIDVTHPYLADLRIYLVAPNNDILNLCNSNGGTGDNFSGTTFVDSASTNLTMGNPPYFGYYKPSGNTQAVCGVQPTVASFSVIGGGSINPNGLWKLLVYDIAGGDLGTLNYWSIKISEADNFIPKWINGTLSNISNLYDNGTNIGIGTTTPFEKLTVKSNNDAIIRVETPSISHESRIEFWKFGGAIGAGVGFYPGNGDLHLRSGENTAITFEPDTLERMRVNPNGNVGIGTSNPVAKLDVNGTIKISGGSPAVGKVLTSDVTGLASWQTETDPQVSSITTNKIPKWNGTSLTDGIITDDGTNIGIGTSTPGTKLHVNGVLRAQADATSSKAIELYKGDGNPGWEMFVTNTGLSICEQNVACGRLVVAAGGNIGIGTSTPGAPLHVTGSAITTASLSRTYFQQGSGLLSGTSASGAIQVRADGWFWANNGGFVATSDQRIKNKIGLTNTQRDLNDLSKIEITNYKYIDEINNGSKLHKKVIAQQLNSVYPLAVDTTKGIIPNVYEVAKHVAVENNSTLITTNKAHDFKTGDDVKFIIENVGEKIVHVEVVDEHTFSVNEIIKDKVFVFGKHIDDLLIVDYDALTTLNISATQELLKRIESLEKENGQLKESNTTLKEMNATNATKISTIEAKLNLILQSTVTAQK